LLGVAVVLSIVGGIGIAAALTADRHARPAAEQASAVHKAAAAQKAPAAQRAPAADETSAADKAQTRAAVRSHGYTLGLVAPLSAQHRGTVGRSGASRAALAARPLARLLAISSRSRKPRPGLVTANALLDPKVTVGTQPTGVAVAATRAYVANQGSNSVSVIDLTQNPPVVVATIPVGSQPDSAVLSANGARLYAANFGSGTVSVIDTATNVVTKTVTVGSRPTGMVEVNGLVYVANLLSSSVSVFDPTLAAPVASSFAVPATGASLSAPSGLAASANGQRLYVNDARNGKTFVFDLTQKPPVSTGNVLNGADTFPAYLAVSGTTGFSANPGTNSVRVLDLSALTATNVPVGSSPYGVVALPSLGEAFAANSGSDDLTVIDTAGTPTALAATVATGDLPDAIAVSPDQQTAVVSNEGEGTVSIFHVNQPPQNTVPGAQSIVYNATAAVHHTIVFSTAAGKQVSTSDADAAASASPLKVTLSVAHGTLTLAQTTGLTFLSGANGQASMSFTGLQADVNAALNGLVYEPSRVFFGADALSLTVDDQGGTGLGKPQATSSSVAISVTDTAPTDIALSPASVNENQPVATTVGSFSTTDPDAGDVFGYGLVAGVGSTDNGSFQLVGNSLQTNAVFNFEAKSSYSIRVRSTDAGGLFFEKALTVAVNNVNEAPVNTVPAALSINEDTALNFTGANAVSVADPDAGAGAIQIQLSVTNGTLTMTTLTGLTFTVGDGTADAAMTFTGTLAAVNTALATLRYNPTANFPGAAASGTAAFSITTNDQGNTGSGGPLSDTDGTTITVNQVNDAPVGGGDSAQTLGNVQLFYDLAPGAGVVGTTKTTASTNGVLDNDSDPVEGSAVSVTGVVGCADVTTPFDCATVNGGSITLDANGRFSFRPSAGSTANDSFQYVLTDNGIPAPASSNVSVSLSFVGNRIWFVKNNQAAGGLGRSNDPFDTLVEAQTAANQANDRVFVYAGDGTSTGQNAGFTFANNNQTLQGEAVALTTGTTVNGINNATLVAAGSQPLIGNAAGIGVTFTNRTGTTITGLSIAGSTKALEMTTSAAATGTTTITGNAIRGAGAEGIDVNLNALTTGTVTLAVTNNTWNTGGTHTGNAIDVNHLAGAGTLNLNLSGNTNVLSTGASGILVAGGAVANTTITGFAGNSVHGNTAGAGITISNATFDSNPVTAGIQQVDGDNLAVGASGNPVGGAGLSITTSQGNLFFDDLDVYAASGTALAASGTGTGLTFTVTPAAPDGIGTSTIDADNGAAVDISTATIDLRLALLESTTAAGGVNLSSVSSVGGQFRAPTGSSITKASGGGTAFTVANSVSGTTVAYAGTLNVTSGAGVSLTSNTGATISFTGGMTLSTGANAAFSATGGGTINVTGAANTLTTTTGTALNVANTTVGASGLTFQSISAGTAASGPANGIVLNNTGSNNALTVTSTGAGTCTAADQTGCTGGTIQHATGSDDSTTTPVGTGIVLKSTKGVSLDRMHILNNSNYGIRGDSVGNGGGGTPYSFKLSNSTFDGANGTETPASGGSPFNEAAIRFTELTGSSSITNSYISGGVSDNVAVINSAGSLNRLTLQSNTFGNNSNTQGNRNINIGGTGTSTVNVTANSNIFTASRSHDFGYDTTGTGGDVVFTNNTMSQSRPATGPGAPATGAGNVKLTSGGSAATTMNVSGNTMTGATGNAMLFVHDTGSGTLTGTVNNNVIGAAGTANSGSLEGDGIQLNHATGTAASSTSVAITNNQVRQYNNFGIELASGSGGLASDAGNISATVTGNTISNPGTNANISSIFQGIQLNSGTVPGQTFQWCLNMKSNSIIGSGRNGGTDFRLRQRQATTVRVPGYGGTAFDTAALTAFIQNQNDGNANSPAAEAPTPTGAAITDAAGGGFVGGAACTSG
jgi:YVTN family beta-propeller protein